MSAQLKLDLFHAPEHFGRLHTDPHGLVLHWERQATAKAWTKLRAGDPEIPAFLAAQRGQPDRYITVNEFTGWRLVRLLKSLRACYVDIDNTAHLDEALDRIKGAGMPMPSLAIMSGQGVHLYWLIEASPAAALPVWQRVQNALIKACGADGAAKDCTRVLRLAGSINSANGAEVRGLVLTGEQWTLHELANEVLGYRPNKPQPKKAKVRSLNIERARRRSPASSIYSRWYLVYRDLLKIADFHGGQIPKGSRNNWLFLSGVALSWFATPDALLDEIERAAQLWTPDLAIEAVRKSVSPILRRSVSAAKGETVEWRGVQSDPRYHFKRETLYEWLQPLIHDALLPSLRAVIPDSLSRSRRKAAWSARELSRDRVAEGRHASHQPGRVVDAGSAAQKQPWAALGISRATYYRRQKQGDL